MTHLADQTHLGSIKRLNGNDVFTYLAETILSTAADRAPNPAKIALTGGSTPKQFYEYAVANKLLSAEALENVHFFTSDERYVGLDSPDNNFGNAKRMLLDPIEVKQHRQHPWATEVSAQQAANTYNHLFENEFKGDYLFHVCFLGMGTDGHTASIFPGSPLLEEQNKKPFAAIPVPGKGMRLTITPYGLSLCEKIVVIATGANKAPMIETVWNEEINPKAYPIQLLHQFADKTTWLIS